MRVTNRNWLRWSFELRIPADDLVRLWMLYREYHDHPVRVADFLDDQRRTVRIMQALTGAANRLREVEHVELQHALQHAASTA